MARLVANVDITTDTWETVVQRENTILDALSNEIITANSTYANTGTPGAQRNAQLFGKFVANTFIVATEIKGGSNTSVFANLNITSNAVFSGAAVNVASNTTFTGTVNSSANVNLTGSTLVIAGTTTNVTSNVVITSSSVLVKANSTVTTLSLTSNSTATNTSIGGTDFNISANVAVTGTISTSTANTTITASNITLKSNSSITALSISGNSTATNTSIGGTDFNISANVAVTGTVHTINGNVSFSTNVLFVDSTNKRVGIGIATPTVALAVNGSLSVTANINVTNTTTTTNLTVSGNTSLDKLDVSNAATFSNIISVTGNATFSNTVAFNSPITLETDLVLDVAANGNIGTSSLPRMVYSFPKATYSTGKFTVQATRTGNNQIAEILLAHDGTNAYLTVYGTVASPAGANTSAPLGTFTTAINNANVEIYMSQTADNTAVKVIAHLIKA